MEDGVHTYDIFVEGVSKQKVGTKEFALAVIERLGQKPSTLKAVDYPAESNMWKSSIAHVSKKKQ